MPTGPVDRSAGDVHAGGNPHFLLDPVAGVQVAEALAARLGALRPADAAVFTANAAALRAEIGRRLVGDALAARFDGVKLALLAEHDRLDAFLAEQGVAERPGGWLGALAPYRDHAFAADHDLWPYLAARFRLRVALHLEPKPGVPPSARHLADVVQRMRTERIRVLVTVPYVDRRHADVVLRATGARHARARAPGERTRRQRRLHRLDRRQRPSVGAGLRRGGMMETAMAQAAATALINARTLSVGHGARTVLRGLDWQLDAGAWWTITGENGGGKTTLLSTLIGLLPPLAGTLRRAADLAARSGVVMQHERLAQTIPLTIGDVVGMGRIGAAGEPLAALTLLSRLALDPRRSFWRSSGGERQRALIARALIRAPALLVLDEPFNHLDAAGRGLVLSALRDHHAGGGAVLLVSHHLPDALPGRRLHLADGVRARRRLSTACWNSGPSSATCG